MVVATSAYDDGGLAWLVYPAQDAAAYSDVPADPATCAFDVATVLDATLGEVTAWFARHPVAAGCQTTP